VPFVSRRHLLQRCSLGFGSLALASMLSEESESHASSATSPLSPRATHFPARAKRVVFLFMKGGPSHIDTFDHKPQLERDHGKELPFAKPRVQFAETSTLLKSPWTFSPRGESGIPVSELFPCVGQHVDDLCILNSVHGTNPAHGGALLKLHTGSDRFVRPSMGSWITYGLGTENVNLPAFITICPTLAHGGVKNWGGAFLPAYFQGTPLGNASMPAAQARLDHLGNPKLSLRSQRSQLDLLRQMNESHLQKTGDNDSLEARIAAFELAFRMQTEMPELIDIADETQETLDLYGLNQPQTEDFGRQCLLARRFLERGVRFVQVTHSDSNVQWDQHANLVEGHTKNAAEVDLPIAGFLSDLKRRGLLRDTLVIWGGEFGRTPTMQGKNGRDHNPEGFTIWLAGAGVRSGIRYGATDEYGYYAVENKMHIHDFHATVLHLLGLDHKRLTYRYAGRDFRLTDVAGEVAHGVM
jgi:hypothetical protein